VNDNRPTDDGVALPFGAEPLTAEEKEAFFARIRSEGRVLTAQERRLLFGPPPDMASAPRDVDVVEEMEPAHLEAEEIARLETDFFPEIGHDNVVPALHLVTGVIFDFDFTLATLRRPLEELMTLGAQQADAYMRSMGMNLPDEFWRHIVEARRFAEEKSEEEQEEHLADDALSFLLQFFGYPASEMNPDVLRRAVDIFYAPEMTAWQLRPGVKESIQSLHSQGYKLAVLANYNSDRVFQRTIDYLGIRPYLDLCLCSASVEFRKPDVRFFQIVLDRWGALPYEVVIVGDSLRHDIAGGIELGSLTVQVALDTLPQIAHDNRLHASQIIPDAVLDSLAQLPEIIRQWT
jgi:putative hydrolase of the HAD superfamily